MKGTAFWKPSEVSSWMDCRKASSEVSTGRTIRRSERQILRFVREAMVASWMDRWMDRDGLLLKLS